MAPREAREPRDAGGPAGLRRGAQLDRGLVGAQHDVGVEDGEQRVEVPLAGRREERLDELGLPQPAVMGLDRRDDADVTETEQR